MRNFIFSIAAIAALMNPLAASAPAQQGLFPYPVHRETLENGLKIIIIPTPAEGLASYWTIVRTGSRDEVEKGVTGFAHFFEHMMFRGSDKYPGKVYDEIVSSMGADSNASTWDDKTVYHLAIASADLPTVIEIESDRFQNLNYNESQFRTEAGAVYGEYRKGRTNPFEVLYESLQETAFDVHTYKHTTIGFESDIKDMPNQFKYSRTFFERFYRPENVIICIAGDVNPAATMELLKSKYSGWKKGYVSPAIQPEPPQKEQRRVNVQFDGQTLPILAIGFKGERFLANDKTMQAGKILDELCFGETSPLYKKLVLEEQRLEQLATDFDSKRDMPLWTVFAVVKDAADIPNIEKEIMGALEDIRKNGVSAERLKAVISRGKYGFLSSLSTPTEVNERLAPYIALAGDMSCIEEMFQTRDQLTPDDVKRAANLYFTETRSTVAVLRAKGAAGAVAAPAPVPSENILLMDVPNDPNIAIKFWFGAGSQDDPRGKEGLAALTAALVSEGGSKTLRYDQILQLLFPMAAGYGAGVDREMTVFSGLTHRDHAAKFSNIFVDAVTNPGFRQEDFERLRDRAINGIEKNLRYSSDEELGKAELYHSVFEGTPYANIVDGTVAGLKAITLADVVEFYKKYYTKDNLHIAVGGTKPAEVASEIAGRMGSLAPGKPPAVAKSVAAPIRGRQVSIIEKPGPSTAISFGHPIPVLRGTKDYYALSVARSWLGEHRNSFSHLYQVIREARGLNYGNYAYIEAFPNGGSLQMPPTGVARRSQIFEVWIRPLPEKEAHFALRAAIREVDQLIQKGMSEEDFKKTRDFLVKYSLHYAETTAERLGYALEDRFYGIPNHLAKFRSAMKELTVADVNAAVKKYLQTENMKIAIVTEHGAEMAAALAADAPSPIVYKSEKPAEVLAEDREIEKYPLHIPAANIRVTPVDSVFESSQPEKK